MLLILAQMQQPAERMRSRSRKRAWSFSGGTSGLSIAVDAAPGLQRGRSVGDDDDRLRRPSPLVSPTSPLQLTLRNRSPKSGRLRIRLLDALQFSVVSDVHAVVQLGTQIRITEGTQAIEFELNDWEETQTTGPERHTSFLLFQLQHSSSEDLFGTFVLELQELHPCVDVEGSSSRWV